AAKTEETAAKTEETAAKTEETVAAAEEAVQTSPEEHSEIAPPENNDEKTAESGGFDEEKPTE
ncbi:MAG: hypothetical protein IJI24_00310, partial [Lachnospiraceae bacterium]|nr:hypothetical protein [Lachnospiraceae bacterium]